MTDANNQAAREDFQPAATPSSDGQPAAAAQPDTPSTEPPKAADAANSTERPPAAVPKTSRTRTADPTSIEEFAAYAYSRRGRRLTCKKKTALAIAKGPTPGDDFWEMLHELARSDTLFAVPRQILLAAMPHRSIAKAWHPLYRVCITAFQSHPASSEPFSALTNADPRIDHVALLLQRAADANYTAVCRGDGTTPIKQSEAITLRNNVVSSLALWALAVLRLDSGALLRALHECLWDSDSRRVKSDSDRWRHVLESRDLACSGIIASAFIAESDVLRANVELAQRAEAAARCLADNLTSQVDGLSELLSQEQRAVADLRHQLSVQAHAHESAVSHLHDEYERLRARVLRRLKRELELLDEGMLAIRRRPPKVHVMEDHGDRVIAGLREEIHALQSETQP